MIILFFICLLVAIGFFLYHFDYDILGIFVIGIFGFYLLIHITGLIAAPYEYNKFVRKRQAFVETLAEARNNNRQIELAAIAKDISSWNEELAESKYDRELFFLKDYVDSRVDSLKPIK
jgi:hypothetical protein